jgi:integrase
VALGEGVYRDPRTGHFYCRPTVEGRRTWRVLHSTTLTAARRETAKKLTDHKLSRDGLAHDPFAPARDVTVGDLLESYAAAGCPGRKDRARSPDALRYELRHVATLRRYFTAREAASITLEDCGAYHRWRCKGVEAGRLDRQTDKELATLSNAFRWAARNARKTGIRANPVGLDRPRFRDGSAVRHARDRMPRDGDELNTLAAHLLAVTRSEVLGWAALFQAMTGQRIHELLRLRMDARNEDDPGYVSNGCLHLWRSKSSKGTYPFARVHNSLRECLAAHAAWHRARFPGSVWFFPSPDAPERPVGATALTHALRRVSAGLGLPARTSHGLRSFYVNVLRSQGVADSEVALRVGQRTAGRLIVDVYGEILPYRLDWRPARGAAAWEEWLRANIPPGIPSRNVKAGQGWATAGKATVEKQAKKRENVKGWARLGKACD